MIEGDQFIETVKAYFDFLVVEFDFKILEQEIRGNAFYDVRYKKDVKLIVSISYENIEDYLQVIIYILQNGALPHYNDNNNRLHLKDCIAKVLPFIDQNAISKNNEYFLKFHAKDELERALLKSAKELRLCLKHFDLIQEGDS